MLNFIRSVYKSLSNINSFEEKLSGFKLKIRDLESEFSESENSFEAEIAKKNEKIDELKKEVATLQSKVKELVHPGSVWKEILKGNIEWYDYQSLNPSDRESYQRFAESVRTNPVFQNELNHLFQTICMRTLGEPKTLEELRDFQISAVAIQSIKEHFNEIPLPPKKPEEVEEPNATF